MAKEKKVKNSEKEEMIKHAFELINKALLLNDKSSAVHKWMAILLDAKSTLEGTKARIQALPDFKKHLMVGLKLFFCWKSMIYVKYCVLIHFSMQWNLVLKMLQRYTFLDNIVLTLLVCHGIREKLQLHCLQLHQRQLLKKL